MTSDVRNAPTPAVTDSATVSASVWARRDMGGSGADEGVMQRRKSRRRRTSAGEFGPSNNGAAVGPSPIDDDDAGDDCYQHDYRTEEARRPPDGTDADRRMNEQLECAHGSGRTAGTVLRSVSGTVSDIIDVVPETPMSRDDSQGMATVEMTHSGLDGTRGVHYAHAPRTSDPTTMTPGTWPADGVIRETPAAMRHGRFAGKPQHGGAAAAAEGHGWDMKSSPLHPNRIAFDEVDVHVEAMVPRGTGKLAEGPRDRRGVGPPPRFEDSKGGAPPGPGQGGRHAAVFAARGQGGPTRMRTSHPHARQNMAPFEPPQKKVRIHAPDEAMGNAGRSVAGVACNPQPINPQQPRSDWLQRKEGTPPERAFGNGMQLNSNQHKQYQEQERQQSRQEHRYESRGYQQHARPTVQTQNRDVKPPTAALEEADADGCFVTDEELELSSWLPREWAPKLLKGFEAAGIKGLKLYLWQAACLMQCGVREGRRNLVYTAPTSGGKSMVSDILMLRRLLLKGRPSLLVLPYVAVCDEKRRFLEKVLEPLHYTVQGFYGGQSTRNILKTGVGIAITTIESANRVINTLIEEDRLHDVGCVVVDELHMVGDRSRGEQLEILLSKMMYINGNGDSDDTPQIIGMSATLPNLQRVAEWLNAELYETKFRPTQLEKLVKVDNVLKDADGKPVAELPRRSDDVEKLDPHHVAYLTNEVVKDGDATLIFCPMRKLCETEAKKLADSTLLTVPSVVPAGVVPRQFYEEILANIRTVDNDRIDVQEQRDKAVSQLRKLRGNKESEHSQQLAHCIARGVAYHHAGLSSEERELVERAYKGGAVRVLTATSTLAAGVNLPAKRVIFREPFLFANGKNTPLDKVPTNFLQMAGRAGRSGIDKSGQAIVLVTARRRPGFRDADGNEYWNQQEKDMLTLLNAGCEDLKSCLSGDREGMQRAMLDIISTRAVCTLNDMEAYIKCTLYQKTDSLDKVVADTKSAMEHLLERQLVTPGINNQYYATNFGSAAVAGMMNPEFSQTLCDELERARDGLVLSTDLHLVYLIMVGIGNRPENLKMTQDRYIRLRAYQVAKKRLSENKLHSQSKSAVAHLKVWENVGVNLTFVLAKARGESPRSEKQATICARFYHALIILELCQEKPLEAVKNDYDVSVAEIESLQEQAGYAAAKVVDFCEKMGWEDLTLLLGKLRSRVAIGVRPEIAALAEIGGMRAPIARALYKVGLRTPEQVVNAHNGKEILGHLVRAGLMQEDWKHLGLCSKILRNARSLLKQKQQQQKEEQRALELALRDVPEYDHAAATRARAAVAGSPTVAPRREPESPDTMGSLTTLRSQMPFIATFMYYGSVDGADASSGEIERIFSDMPHWQRLSFYIHADMDNGGEHNKAVILGISLCGGQEAAYGCYLPMTFTVDVKAGRNTTSIHMFDSDRWARLMKLFERKDLKKYTWDLKSQLFAIRQQYSDIGEFRKTHKMALLDDNVFCMRLASWLRNPELEYLFDKNDNRDGPGWISRVESLERFVQSLPSGEDMLDMCRKLTASVALEAAGKRGRGILKSCKRAVYSWFISRPIRDELKKHKLLDAYHEIEMPLVPILMEAERRGIGFDSTTFSTEKEALEEKIRRLKDKAFRCAGKSFDIDSPSAVSEVIYHDLNIAPPPGAKKGVRGHYSTSSDVLEEILHVHSIVPTIVEYRSLDSLLTDFKSLCTTRDASNVRQLVAPSPTSRTFDVVRPHIMQTSSMTGRVVMDEPNLQKVPRPKGFVLTQQVSQDTQHRGDEIEANLRSAFVPRDGCVFVGGDYAQAELRLMAHFSQDQTLLTAFKQGRDPFRAMAAKWLGKRDENSVTQSERHNCKQLTYGLLYGMGVSRLAKSLKIDDAQAREHSETFKKAYPKLMNYFEKVLADCRKNGYIECYSGRKRFIPEINSLDQQARGAAERKAINSVFQGSAADMIKRAMIDIQRKLYMKIIKSKRMDEEIRLVHEVRFPFD